MRYEDSDALGKVAAIIIREHLRDSFEHVGQKHGEGVHLRNTEYRGPPPAPPKQFARKFRSCY